VGAGGVVEFDHGVVGGGGGVVSLAWRTEFSCGNNQWWWRVEMRMDDCEAMDG